MRAIKWIVNVLISVPILLGMSWTCFYIAIWLGSKADKMENTSNLFLKLLLALGVIIGLLVALATGMLCLIVLFTGTGLIWRRVDAGEWTNDKGDGRVYRFERFDLLPRWHPIFRGRKVYTHSPL